MCSFFSHRVNLCVCARVLRICHDKKQNVALKIKSQTEKSRTKISSPSTFISSILCCCYCHCYSYCHCCCCCCCSLFLILCIYHFLFFNLSRLDTTLWLVTMVSDRYACGWHFGQQKTPFDIFYLVFILRSLGISLLTLSIFFFYFFSLSLSFHLLWLSDFSCIYQCVCNAGSKCRTNNIDDGADRMNKPFDVDDDDDINDYQTKRKQMIYMVT